MSNTERPLGTPDPDAVKQLLGEMTGPVELDVAPEVVADLMGGKKDEAEDSKSNTPLDPSLDARSPSISGALAWALTVPDTGTVEVTETEKALFIKAALNDTEVRFPIQLPIGDTEVPVVCRTLSTWELDVMYGALNEDEKSGMFRDMAQYTTTMQQYVMSMQIVSFNDTPLEHLTFDSDGNLKSDIERLRVLGRKHVGKWGSVRWSTALLALRLFSVKIKLCTDAVLNRDFWQPPGTV